MQSLFNVISILVSFYSFVCIIRILMSWLPQTADTSFGRFISRICDPYLNWFRRFSFTRIGVVDFSPILALGVLSAVSMIFSMIAQTGRISIGFILGALLRVIWSFFSFLLLFFIIFLIIRLVYDLFNRYGYSSFWAMLDRFLNPLISYVTRFFGRGISYRASLIVTLVILLVIRVGLGIGVEYLYNLLIRLPI
ncbi:YggT family protein [Brucepastera parasyntrophica]|uniref:YggT family protein n=1 Tax=Brucepastera parasyntrophica TaxID=2880008 RepID=UPI00210C7D7C|nr:YggT family protein [Brucepastera parasyntrophica]ULQ60579.1 YggT family protein [Brucepastera parasyntrophica]